VINAAARANVDEAEKEPARAFAVNAAGAANVARACLKRRIRCIHVSTDYVFDGRGARPYREDDPVGPVNAYGASKVEGERLVRDAGATVVRTSWLIPSFAARIFATATREGTVRVVDDQHSCPTVPDDLADALIALARAAPDTYHFANQGPASRYELAVAVVEFARRARSLAHANVVPIATGTVPVLARRPAYTVLDTSRVRAAGISAPPWRERLDAALAALEAL
jgi:dTDP-4-dehydrorhamnose reductase